MQLYSVAAASGSAICSSQWSCGRGRRVSSPVVTDGNVARGHGGHTSWSAAAAREMRLPGCGREERHADLARGRPAGWIRAAAAAGPLEQGCAPYPVSIPSCCPGGPACCLLLAACYLLLAPHARVLRWAAWPKRAVDRWRVTTPTRTTAMGIYGVSGYCESWLGKRGPGSCPGRQPEQ